MIGVIRTGYALATHWISDTIDVSPEARRAADAAATEAAAQRLITPAVSRRQRPRRPAAGAATQRTATPVTGARRGAARLQAVVPRPTSAPKRGRWYGAGRLP